MGGAYFFSRRSALDALLPFQPHLQGLKAKAAVKANSDAAYKVFAVEIGTMVTKLDVFCERAQILLAEAAALGMSSEDAKLLDSAKALTAQAKCAESHHSGATAAIGRFSAIFGCVNPLAKKA